MSKKKQLNKAKRHPRNAQQKRATGATPSQKGRRRKKNVKKTGLQSSLGFPKVF